MCWNIVDYHVRIRDYVPITGEIVDFRESYSVDNPNLDTNYVTFKAIEVEYEVDGITYTAMGKVRTLNGKYFGDEVKFYYNPDNPSEVAGLAEISIGEILIFAIPILIIIGLSYNLIRTHKIKKRRQGLCEEREL